MNPLPIHLPSSPRVRERFDLAAAMLLAQARWQKLGKAAKVSVELIVGEQSLPIWSCAESILVMMSRLILDAIEACIEGERVEVLVRPTDRQGDWVSLSVRDWAGGRAEAWSLEAQVNTLAKELEGFLDVTNFPGRGTLCTLSLPTGKLGGWLRRQPRNAFAYHVSWKSIERWDRSTIGRAIQAFLMPIGSITPLGSQGYLLATAHPNEQDRVTSSLNRSIFANARIAESDLPRIVVEPLGLISEFYERLERSASQAGAPRKVAPKAVRFDGVNTLPTSHTRPIPSPTARPLPGSNVLSPSERTRPRHATFMAKSK